MEKVAPLLVDFTWGPDHFGYDSDTEMFQLSNGHIYEREILVRVTDMSRYPQAWFEFMHFDLLPENLRVIKPNTIVNEEEGSPKNPIDISDDEEEFVPANLDMSDDDE